MLISIGASSKAKDAAKLEALQKDFQKATGKALDDRGANGGQSKAVDTTPVSKVFVGTRQDAQEQVAKAVPKLEYLRGTKINFAQRVVLRIGAAVVAGLFLFPPFFGKVGKTEYPLGHHWFLTTQSAVVDYMGVNWQTLLTMLLGVVVVVALCYTSLSHFDE